MSTAENRLFGTRKSLVFDKNVSEVYSLGVKLKLPPMVRLSVKGYINSASAPGIFAPSASSTDVVVPPVADNSAPKVWMFE